MKRAVVCGAGGFIGHHLVKRLKSEGYHVVGLDRKVPEFEPTDADEFHSVDLRQVYLPERNLFAKADEVYQLAAEMGGAGFIFTGDNDYEIMRNSALINMNVLHACYYWETPKLFFSSSACVYQSLPHPDRKPKQTLHGEPWPVSCEEHMAYPADPDSEYGWEKLFAERMYAAYARNFKLNVRVARFHNIFGPLGTWDGGREKAPAAICRKIAEAKADGRREIEIWGDGNQQRSFLYIDECIEGVRRFMRHGFQGPLNIGSSEMVTIRQLVQYISWIAEWNVDIVSVPGPLGVHGRNSDNRLSVKEIYWQPTQPLTVGLEKTYAWIERQVLDRRAGKL